jgi:lyso-ornithine lipid O-acyltransferase
VNGVIGFLERLGRRLRITMVLVCLAPVLLLGIVLQLPAIKLGLGYRRHLPMLFHRCVCWLLGVRVHQRGSAAMLRPMLVVSNHVSWLDISVIGSVMPLCFIAKSEVETWPVIGLLARLQRSIFVVRNRRAETKVVNGRIAARLAEGDPIVLFGEGTTGDGNRVLPFRSALIGAARESLAVSASDRMAVQPLAITYVRRNGLPLGRTERPGIAWYGAMELAPHLADLICAGPIDVVLSWGEVVLVEETSNRKALVCALESDIRRMSIIARTGREPLAAGLSSNR